MSFYGRNIESKGKDDRHFYTANRKGLYPNYPDAATETITLTESIIDAATLQLYTTYKTLSLFGTNVLNEEHKAALQSLPKLQEIIMFLNGDAAGREWTAKHSETLHELLPQITISTVKTPDEEDINSLIVSHEPEILQHLISKRQILFSSLEQSNEKEKPAPEIPITPTITTIGKLNTSNADYISFVYENLLFSIVGGIALYPLDKLKFTLKIQVAKSLNPLHTIRQSNLDLYSEEQAEKFVRRASEKLEAGSKQIKDTIPSYV